MKERSWIEPTTEDGRNIGARGLLKGEAGRMQSQRPGEAWPLASAEQALPTAQAPHELTTPTYYGMPVVKAPPWRWYIPAYFYVGGVSGVTAMLGAAVRLARRQDLDALARKVRRMAALGSVASAAFLILDLGRPLRFLNMLRVIRPTSPMSLGSWFLSACGATSTGALVLGRRWPRAGSAMELLGGVTGAPMTTYTAVLIANSAIPAWNGARRTLPALFGASAAASTASLLELRGSRNAGEERLVRRMSAVAKAGEVAAMYAVERELGAGCVSRPLRRGRSGRLWRAAKLLGLASLAATLWPGRSRNKQLLAGALGTAGAVAMRFAIVEAGEASGRDPHATMDPQRARHQRRRTPDDIATNPNLQGDDTWLAATPAETSTRTASR